MQTSIFSQTLWTGVDQTLPSVHLCWPTRRGHGHGIAYKKLSASHRRRRLEQGLGRMLSGQITDQTMRVLEGVALPCRRLAVYPGLSNDRPWDNYCRSALFAWDVRSCTIVTYLLAPWYHKIDESPNHIVISRNRYEPKHKANVYTKHKRTAW